ncbi:hypothetical protein SAMN05216436_10922 [bacterium A37T11]|nr:hypothetical protein SAMN05216436_10922 [bacterium A37T11]
MRHLINKNHNTCTITHTQLFQKRTATNLFCKYVPETNNTFYQDYTNNQRMSPTFVYC